MKKCPFCGAEISDSCLVCPSCGKSLPTRPQNPFEDEQRTFFDRSIDTVKHVLASPADFFSSLNPQLDISKGYLYFLMILTVAVIADTFWNLFLGTQLRAFFAQMDSGLKSTPFGDLGDTGGMGIYFSMILRLVIGAIQPFITAGVYHVALLSLGEGKNGYRATLNAVFFAATPMLLYAIPLGGAFFAFFWILALQVIAISKLQSTTTGRALFSVFAIYLVLIVFVLAAAVLIFALGAAAL